jgi:hypothetical protein
MAALKVVGFEAESTIVFAAIQRLTMPQQERLVALPDRQRLASRWPPVGPMARHRIASWSVWAAGPADGGRRGGTGGLRDR